MNIEEIMDNSRIEILNKFQEVSKFNSNVKDLDDFLKNKAYIQSKLNLNVTYIIIYKKEIIAYFSLLSDSIRLKDINEIDILLKEKKYKNFPAIKLGKFAVDTKYQGIGLGSIIFKEIMWNINLYSKKVGVRFITLDAYATSFNFYFKKQNCNYYKKEKNKVLKINKIIKQNPLQPISLYKDLKKL